MAKKTRNQDLGRNYASQKLADINPQINKSQIFDSNQTVSQNNKTTGSVLEITQKGLSNLQNSNQQDYT